MPRTSAGFTAEVKPGDTRYGAGGFFMEDAIGGYVSSASKDGAGRLSITQYNAAGAAETVTFDPTAHLHTTTGQPADSVGNDDDWALDGAANTFYRKSGGTWSVLATITGFTLRSGAGAPASGLGNQNDWYVNTTNNSWYEKTAASTWTRRFTVSGGGGGGTKADWYAFGKQVLLDVDVNDTDQTLGIPGVFVSTTDPPPMVPDGAVHFNNSDVWIKRDAGSSRPLTLWVYYRDPIGFEPGWSKEFDFGADAATLASLKHLNDLTGDLRPGPSPTGWVDANASQGGIAVGTDPFTQARARAASTWAITDGPEANEYWVFRIPSASAPAQTRLVLRSSQGVDFPLTAAQMTRLGASADGNWIYYSNGEQFGADVQSITSQVTGSAAHVGQSTYIGNVLKSKIYPIIKAILVGGTDDDAAQTITLSAGGGGGVSASQLATAIANAVAGLKPDLLNFTDKSILATLAGDMAHEIADSTRVTVVARQTVYGDSEDLSGLSWATSATVTNPTGAVFFALRVHTSLADDDEITGGRLFITPTGFEPIPMRDFLHHSGDSTWEYFTHGGGISPISNETISGHFEESDLELRLKIDHLADNVVNRLLTADETGLLETLLADRVKTPTRSTRVAVAWVDETNPPANMTGLTWTNPSQLSATRGNSHGSYHPALRVPIANIADPAITSGRINIPADDPINSLHPFIFSDYYVEHSRSASFVYYLPNGLNTRPLGSGSRPTATFLENPMLLRLQAKHLAAAVVARLLPSGGSNGQFLGRASGAPAWVAAPAGGGGGNVAANPAASTVGTGTGSGNRLVSTTSLQSPTAVPLSATGTALAADYASGLDVSADTLVLKPGSYIVNFQNEVFTSASSTSRYTANNRFNIRYHAYVGSSAISFQLSNPYFRPIADAGADDQYGDRHQTIAFNLQAESTVQFRRDFSGSASGAHLETEQIRIIQVNGSKGDKGDAGAGGGTDATARSAAADAQATADAALPKAGGTMTGKITLDGAPTANLHAATKKYVDDNAGGGGGSPVAGTRPMITRVDGSSRVIIPQANATRNGNRSTAMIEVIKATIPTLQDVRSAFYIGTSFGVGYIESSNVSADYKFQWRQGSSGAWTDIGGWVLNFYWNSTGRGDNAFYTLESGLTPSSDLDVSMPTEFRLIMRKTGGSSSGVSVEGRTLQVIELPPAKGPKGDKGDTGAGGGAPTLAGEGNCAVVVANRYVAPVGGIDIPSTGTFGYIKVGGERAPLLMFELADLRAVSAASAGSTANSSNGLALGGVRDGTIGVLYVLGRTSANKLLFTSASTSGDATPLKLYTQ